MPKRNKYTKELITEAVKDSISWAEVCRKLNVKPFTGAQCHVKKRAVDFGVDYSHFLGKAFNRGRTFKRMSLDVYLSNERFIKSDDLKKRLLRDGLKQNVCERCKQTEWCGEPIPLELDHKDSNHWNNNLDNLWVICPNCHAQETSSRRKISPL